MTNSPLPTRSTPLRAMVLATTGQDVRRCSHCELCTEMTEPDQDLSLESVIQLIVINDEEVLTSRTVWSDAALASARHVCTSNLDMEVVLLALRDEARRRGLTGPATDHHRSNELESGEFQESSL